MGKISSKSVIIVGFSAILVVIISLLAIGYNSVSESEKYLKEIKGNNIEVFLLSSLLTELNEETLNVHRVLGTKNRRHVDFVNAKLGARTHEILRLSRLLDDVNHHKNALSWRNLSPDLQRYTRFINDAVAVENVQASDVEKLLSSIVPIHDKINKGLLVLLDEHKKDASEGVASALERNEADYTLLYLLVAMAILMGLLNAFILRHSGRAEAAMVEQGRRIRRLYEITSKPGLNSEEQIRQILELGCSLLGMQIGKVCQIDKVANTNSFLNVYAPLGFRVCAGTVMPLDKTFCSITTSVDEPIALFDVSKSKYGKQFTHLSAYISTEISVSGSPWGTVNFSSNIPAEKPFNETDVDLLKLIAAWVSSTLERRFGQEELMIAKNDAESASRTKSSFLASMSHELRTPLNAIIGYSELMAEEAEYNKHDMYGDDLHKVNSSALHLLALIDDILDLSKIEAGKMEFYLEDIDIDSVINEVKSTVQPLMKKKNNKFIVNIEGDLGQMHTDRLRLKQVMFNLLSNASKFTEEGEVLFNIQRVTRVIENRDHDQDWLIFKVVDSGIGVSKEQISKIFQAFSQADLSTTSKFGGTGLGLAISRHICEMMGGEIVVVGAIGQGATFTVSLPCRFQ